MGKRNEVVEIDIDVANAEELKIMAPIIAGIAQNIHELAMTPMQESCDGAERIEMAQMRLPMEMAKLRVQHQQMQLQIEQLKTEQRRLLAAPQETDEEEPHDRLGSNGNGAGKSRR